MQGKPSRRRQKRCKACRKLFQPDPRTKGKQRYCSRTACQTQRQRHNEKEWRVRNPECVELQQEQSRRWQKARPDYSRKRRSEDPQLLKHNRGETCKRMRKIRAKKLFDKSKLILTQLAGNKTATAILDRLNLKGTFITLEGRSYRSKQ